MFLSSAKQKKTLQQTQAREVVVICLEPARATHVNTKGPVKQAFFFPTCNKRKRGDEKPKKGKGFHLCPSSAFHGTRLQTKKGTPRVSGDPTDGGANKHGKGGGENAKLLTNTSVIA